MVAFRGRDHICAANVASCSNMSGAEARQIPKNLFKEN
jgi:hypothetical protein